MRSLGSFIAGLAFLVGVDTIHAQQAAVATTIDVRATLPVGNFSDTHFGGAGLSYTPSFTGLMLNRDGSFAFSAKAGFDFYKGKKEKIGTYTYQQRSLTMGFLDGQLSYALPGVHATISLSAGPGVGVTNSRTFFMLHMSGGGRYFINSRFSLGPVFELLKEPGTNTLSAIGVQAGLSFF